MKTRNEILEVTDIPLPKDWEQHGDVILVPWDEHKSENIDGAKKALIGIIARLIYENGEFIIKTPAQIGGKQKGQKPQGAVGLKVIIKVTPQKENLRDTLKLHKRGEKAPDA